MEEELECKLFSPLLKASVEQICSVKSAFRFLYIGRKEQSKSLMQNVGQIKCS